MANDNAVSIKNEGVITRKTESLLEKKVPVRRMGSFVGGSLFVAVVAGLFWHRRAIKRLIEINRM